MGLAAPRPAATPPRRPSPRSPTLGVPSRLRTPNPSTIRKIGPPSGAGATRWRSPEDLTGLRAGGIRNGLGGQRRAAVLHEEPQDQRPGRPRVRRRRRSWETGGGGGRPAPRRPPRRSGSLPG